MKTFLSKKNLLLAVALIGASLPVFGQEFVQGKFKFTVNPDNVSVSVSTSDKNAGGEAVIPSTVTNEGTVYTVTAIKKDAFNGSKITSVFIPKTISTIGSSAFENCYDMSDIVFEEGSAVKVLEDHCFKHCNKVKSMVVPEGVTKLGEWSLEGLEKMFSLTLPSTLTYMSRGCLAFNRELSVLTINAATPPELQDAGSELADPFREVPVERCTLFVPEGAAEAYAGAEYWNRFGVITSGSSDVFTQGAFTFGVIGNNEASVLEFDRSTTTPVIPSKVTFKGVEYNVTTIAGSLFAKSEVTSVELPSTLKYIGDNAFHLCGKLTKVNLPDGLETIGEFAFAYTDVHEFYVPNTVTYIGQNCFPVTTETLELSNSLKVITKQLCTWSHLTGITVPEGVTTIEDEAFVCSKSLKRIVLPSTLTTVGRNVFGESPTIISIYCCAKKAPSGGTEGMFQQNVYNSVTLCVPVGSSQSYRNTAPWSSFVSIREVNYETDPEFVSGGIRYRVINSSTVEVIGVDNPPSLISIPNAVLRNGSYMTVAKIADNAFVGSSIKNVEIAQSVKKIGQNAFGGLSLSSVKAFALTAPECYDNSFSGDTYNNATLTVGAQCKSSYADATGWRNFRKVVEEIQAGNIVVSGKYLLTIKEDQCVSIGYTEEALHDPTIKEIIIPEEVEYEGVTYTVTGISPGGFEKLLCPGITPEGKNHLQGCTESVRVVLPETIEEIGERAFYQAHVSSINLPESLTTLGKECFSQALLENDIVIPGGVTVIPKDAFSWIWKVKKVTLSSGVEEIEESAFIFSEIREYYIPSTVCSIGNQAFAYGMQRKVEVEDLEGFMNLGFGDSGANPLCSNADLYYKGEPVTEIDFSDYFISELGEFAFYGCTSLEKVIFPRNFRAIGYQCFYNAYKIRTVECRNETCIETQYTGNPFSNSTINFGTLYVPVGCKAEYVDNQVSRAWSAFVNVVEKDFGGIDEVEADGADITVSGSDILNPGGGRVRVYDVAGSLVHEGSEAVITLPRGFYIVAAGDKTVKISIN